MNGAVAQLGEHLLCKQGVSGSIPLSSTIFVARRRGQRGRAGHTDGSVLGVEKSFDKKRQVCTSYLGMKGLFLTKS